MKGRVQEQIEKVFRPEFLNRVDDVIVFRHLTQDDLGDVIEMELKKVRDRLSERNLKLVLSDEAKTFLIKKGSNLDFGARPLRRAIENFVEDPLSEELLKGEFQGMDTITIEVKEVGDKKQLYFRGSVGAAPATPATPASSEPRRRWAQAPAAVRAARRRRRGKGQSPTLGFAQRKGYNRGWVGSSADQPTPFFGLACSEQVYERVRVYHRNRTGRERSFFGDLSCPARLLYGG